LKESGKLGVETRPRPSFIFCIVLSCLGRGQAMSPPPSKEL